MDEETGLGIEGLIIHLSRGKRILATTTTDADGAFTLPRPERKNRRVEVIADGWRVSPTRQRLNTEETEGRTQIMFRATALDILVAGSVTEIDGNPVAGAKVWIEMGADWQGGTGAPKFSAKADEYGQFQIRGNSDEERIWIKASHPDFASSTPRASVTGATELALVLEQGGALSGSVLLAPYIPLDEIFVIQVRSNPDEQPAIAQNIELVESVFLNKNKLVGESLAKIDSDGTFLLQNVRPGMVDIRVGIEGDLQPLASIEAVHAVAGSTTTDPRLNPIDLRSSLSRFELSISDVKGKPVSYGSVRVLPSGQPGPLTRVRFRRGKASFLSRHDRVDIAVDAWNYRSTIVTDLDGDRKIVLTAGLVAHILLEGATVPEPPFFLHASLQPQIPEADQDHFLMSYGGVSHLENFNAGAELDSQGRATLIVPHPGRYRVHWLIMKKSVGGMNSRTPWEEPDTFIDVEDALAEQMFPIKLANDAVISAMKKLGD